MVRSRADALSRSHMDKPSRRTATKAYGRGFGGSAVRAVFIGGCVRLASKRRPHMSVAEGFYIPARAPLLAAAAAVGDWQVGRRGYNICYIQIVIYNPLPVTRRCDSETPAIENVA